MKLDVNILRYLSKDEWRVLTAIEMGQKNHEMVPTPLVDSIAKLKHGSTHKSLSTLLRHKLVHHENVKYDGYRLTYMGYDFLAINTLMKRGLISSVGRQIGVGKESDIFEVANDEGEVMVLKLHRLGRTSFRDVKSKRDYLGRGKHYSWLYLSRLAAIKEYAFMKALGERGLPVPVAYDNNRHAVLMELVDAFPLVQVRAMENAGVIYARLMDLLSQMVRMGLIHCDFNEFNILVSRTYAVTIIDFPQMVSIQHTNAQELFERDVQCVMRFFRKKLNIEIDDDDRPVWAELVADARAHDSDTLDATLAASGFNHKDEAALRAALDAPARDDDDEDSNDEDSGDEDGADEDGADGDGGGASRESYCASGNESEVSSVDAAALPGDVAGLPGDGAGLPGDVAALPGDAAPALPADRSSAQTSGSRNGIVQPDLAHLGLADLPASSADVVTPAARAAPAARDVPAARESVLLTDPEEEIGDEEQTAGPDSSASSAAIQARVNAQRKSAAAREMARKVSRNAYKGRGKDRKESKASAAVWG